MPELSPLLLSRERVVHGLTPNELAKRVKAGTLVRVRHGVYVDGVAWQNLKPWEQYRLRVEAAAETFEKPTVFARRSAASVWGIPFVGLHHPVQALTFKNDGCRSRAGISRHFAPPAGLNVVRRERLLVTDGIRTVLDQAAFTPFAEAVVPMDHVLQTDRTRRLSALTKAELEASIGSNYSAAAGPRIRAVIDFADPDLGSAGGIVEPGTDPSGRLRSPRTPTGDLRRGRLGGLHRFPLEAVQGGWRVRRRGKVRQTRIPQRPDRSSGCCGRKKRENRIRATGMDVVRWDWADLMAGTPERKLAAAGVPRRRTRSAAFDGQFQR